MIHQDTSCCVVPLPLEPLAPQPPAVQQCRVSRVEHNSEWAASSSHSRSSRQQQLSSTTTTPPPPLPLDYHYHHHHQQWSIVVEDSSQCRAQFFLLLERSSQSIQIRAPCSAVPFARARRSLTSTSASVRAMAVMMTSVSPAIQMLISETFISFLVDPGPFLSCSRKAPRGPSWSNK